MPKDEGYKPNESMANAARRGLELRKKNNGKGGTAVGVARARDIANRKNLSLSTVKRMHSFFSRHAGNEKPKAGENRNKDKGYISFLLWGGSPGKKWAKSIVERSEMTTKTIVNDLVKFEALSLDAGSKIDIDSGTIYGAKVIELGRVNDHRPFIVDEETLSEVVAFGNRPNNGIKVRFTHTQESLGNHLGRATNFYRRGQENCVRCDINLVKAAKLAPFNAYDYIMSLAMEDPEALGLSIAFMMDPDTEPVDGLLPVRLKRLYSCDFVGEPNATRGGLFSTENEEDMTIKEKLEGQLDEEIKEQVSFEEHEKKDEYEKEVKDEESSEDPEEEMEDDEDEEEMEHGEDHDKKEEHSQQPAPEYEAYIEAFGDQGAVWFLRKRPLNECFAEYLHEFRKENEDLKKKLKEANAKIEAFSQSLGEHEPASSSPEVELSEAELRHQEFISQKKKDGWSDREIRWASLFSK